MGLWQKRELKGYTSKDLIYVVSMHENLHGQVPTAKDHANWRRELFFTTDIALLDPARKVIDAYIKANPGPVYSQAVTVFFDRQLKIRFVGGTYDTEHKRNLELLKKILAEGG